MNKLLIINSEIEKIDKEIESLEAELYIANLYKEKLDGIQKELAQGLKKEVRKNKDRNVKEMTKFMNGSMSDLMGVGVIDLKDGDVIKQLKGTIRNVAGRDIKDVMREMKTEDFNVEVRIPTVIDGTKSFKENWKKNSKLMQRVSDADKKLQPRRDLRQLGK